MNRHAEFEPDDDRIEVNGPEDIPKFASEEEEARFWDTHTFSDAYWERMPPVPEDELPPVRARQKR